MSDCMEGDGHKYVSAEAYEALLKERNELWEQSREYKNALEYKTEVYDSIVQECDDLKAKLQVAVEALEKIANHKQTSVDKVYLIHQCEGYQTVARKALDALEEALQKIRKEET